jgi:hypothetical protein
VVAVSLGLEIWRKVGCIEGAAGQGGQRVHESDREMRSARCGRLESLWLD